MNSVIIIVAALLPVILLWLYIWKKDFLRSHLLLPPNAQGGQRQSDSHDGEGSSECLKESIIYIFFTKC